MRLRPLPLHKFTSRLVGSRSRPFLPSDLLAYSRNLPLSSTQIRSQKHDTLKSIPCFIIFLPRLSFAKDSRIRTRICLCVPHPILPHDSVFLPFIAPTTECLTLRLEDTLISLQLVMKDSSVLVRNLPFRRDSLFSFASSRPFSRFPLYYPMLSPREPNLEIPSSPEYSNTSEKQNRVPPLFSNRASPREQSRTNFHPPRLNSQDFLSI